MLPKKNRLTRSQVAFVLKKGGKIQGNHFAARFLKGQKTTESRFCVMVSLKVASGAVERNRLRRQIYAALHNILQDQKKSPTDIIIIARNSANGLSFDKIQTHIQLLLKPLY